MLQPHGVRKQKAAEEQENYAALWGQTRTKARGVHLGGFRGRAGTCKDLVKARAARIAKADRRASDLSTTLASITERRQKALC